MGRSPKSYSHRSSSSNQKSSKRRRDSSSSDSDNDRQRHQQRSRDDNKSRSSKIKSFKSFEVSYFVDVRVKEEPVTDNDESRRHRQQKSFEPRRQNPRRNEEQTYQWGKQTEKDKEKEAPVEKEKPNFGLSGALLKDTNTYKGVVIKYSEPLEARKPKRRWRLYVFKGDTVCIFIRVNQLNHFLCSYRNYLCIKFIVNQHI